MAILKVNALILKIANKAYMLSSDRNGFSFKSSMLTSSAVCRNMQHRHNSRILPPDMKNAFLKVFK